MAFTKAPTQDSHGVKRIPALGSQFVSSSTTHPPGSAFYSNCFPLKEAGWAGQEVYGIHKREGYKSTACTGTVTALGPLCAQTVPSYGNVFAFFAKGPSVYYVNYNANTISAALDTKITYGHGTGAAFIDSSNVRRVGWLEGYNGGGALYLFSCDEAGGSVTTTDVSANSLDGTRGLVFIDGYLFAVDSNGSKIFNSAVGGVYTTWNSTNFIDAEQYADRVDFISKHKNYLVAFGSSSIEFFFNNAVEVGSPLARQESYSTRIGLYSPYTDNVSAGAKVVNVEDDLYFLGGSEQNNISLYRIKDFHTEELDSQYIQNVLNSGSVIFRGLSVSVINNNPCIVVNFQYGLPWAYLIRENTWFELSGSDIPTYNLRIGQPLVPPILISTAVAPVCYTFAHLTAYNDTVVYKYELDSVFATTVMAQYTTEVIDFDVNRYKHLARVDAIGDYGNNNLTLGINYSSNYDNPFIAMDPTFQNSSTNGYDQPISWYNCGSPRRFIAQIGIEGTYPAVHRALEIEYNIGVS